MHGRFLMLGALCALATLVAVTVLPDMAFAATGPHALGIDHGWGSLVSQAAPVVLALRAKLAETTTAAAAKIAEVVEGLDQDQVRAIESAHQALLAEADNLRSQIALEEARANQPAPPADPVAIATARAADILSVGTRAGWSRDDIEAAMRGSETVDQVRARAFDTLTSRSGQEPLTPRSSIQRDEGDTLRRGIETAIFLRANPDALPDDNAENRGLREQAREYRGLSVLETFREFHERSGGQRLTGLSKRELASLALGRPATFALRAHATSDFPIILANVASRRLRDAYGEVQRNWTRLGRQSNAPDLKSKDVIALSGLPTFKPIVEGGEYTYATFGESKETYALAKYGRAITITEESLINDDLGVFSRLPEMIGRAASEIQNDLVWGMLTSASTMADGVDLFHATHKNLGTAGDVSETTMAEAERLLAEQLDASGKTPLNLRPKTLVVTPKRKIAAQKLLGSISATKSSDFNPFVNAVDLIVEARLKPSTGTEPWFLFGDPKAIDTFEYAYLDGEEGVIIETRNGFDVDGLQIKGRIFFAVKAIDHRNMVKNAGN